MSKKNKKEKVLFRTDLFGFCKEDVLDYLKELDTAANEQIQSRDARINSQNDEIARLNAQIAEFEASKKAIEAERELISQTLVTAKDTANKVIDEARNDAAKERAELEQSYTAEINKLAAIRNEIIQLRKFATDAIRSFERDLTALERSTIE